jgi:hypothetical protein
MATKYFLKYLVSKPVYDRHGKQIPFEVYGGDFGGIVVDTERDKELVEDLNKLVGTMGVAHSTEDEQRLKKQLEPWNPSNPRSEIRAFNPQKNSSQPQVPAGVAAVANMAIPPLAPMPRTDGPAPAMTQEPPAALPKAFTPPRVARPKVPKGVAAITPSAA